MPLASPIFVPDLTVDLHADTLLWMRWGYNIRKRHSPPLPRAAFFGHLDLPRMIEGGLHVQFFGLVTSPIPRLFSFAGPGARVDRAIDLIEAIARQNSEVFSLARTAEEVRHARHAGKITGFLGIEGAHALEGNLERVAHFANRGVVYLGLVHFSKNEAAFPAWGYGGNKLYGLTDFGMQLIDELNQRKVLVDLAHINRRGFIQAAARSQGPVIVSHTGVSGVHPHWRNIDDMQIRAVAQSGGCIGVIFSSTYLGGKTVEAVCAHLEHLIKVGGEDLPALGSDFDGMIVPPRGLSDVSQLPRLSSALIARGHSMRTVEKIFGENVLRVLKDAVG